MSSSSSSSGSGNRNPASDQIYDVFLSFSHQDTGGSFAPHLYTALTKAGATVVSGEDVMIRGEEKSSHAIEGSRISIIIFSRNYANSRWHLQDLEKIMERRRTMDQTVLPLFYDVDPSDVRHQKGMFGEAFEDLTRNISVAEDKLMSWKAALFEASSIPGFAMTDSRSESEVMENVLERVIKFQDKASLFVAKHPVGVEFCVQHVISLMNNQQSEDPMIIGVWGMGGIGKTTIAKALYNKIHCNFQEKCVLLNIGEAWSKGRHVHLQEQLLHQIYNTKIIKVDSIERGKILLEHTLLHKKVLLILDDVFQPEQLDALCGSPRRFGPGSKIIITTRDGGLLKRLGVDVIYRVLQLSGSDSLELFSWHAFKGASPKEDFAVLSRELIEYACGSPLFLEVIGSLCYGRALSEWKAFAGRLREYPSYMIITEILLLSFDHLDSKEQEIFLYVAYFFIGKDQNDVIHTLNSSGYFAEIGISVLEDRNLVTIDEENKLQMHALLQEMGRGITTRTSRIKPKGGMFDVFLSFRGDTRASFVSHLYTSLKNAGMYVFKDEVEIRRGDHISVSLLQAIQSSKLFVIVLSQNYANSRWCMQELENIMEIHRTMGVVVVPVFYEVDPSDVRNQKGKFGEAFENLLSKISVDDYTKNDWKMALLEVGGIAGSVIINSRNESADIKNIVEHVTRLLDRTELFVTDHPVGVESRVQAAIERLNIQQLEDVFLLGIWGMGGTGKTTIAKAIYNQIGGKFDGRSFLPNIREAWEQQTNQVSLQQRLLDDIYKTMTMKIHSIDSGKNTLKERLAQKRVLVVLDDVDKLDQLNALCGSREWFCPGSRIIITTRNERLLRLRGVNHVYAIEKMNAKESLELFCWHAFKKASPKDDFARHSSDLVTYSGGLPLALEVLGSYLFDRGIKEWESVLDKLKTIPNNEVHEKLKISFDGLSETEREIFLDIACFFIGMDRNDVMQILNGCSFYAEIGINVLMERSLVTIDNKNKLQMHDLLRDMGREIIRQESPHEPEERSRLWLREEVHDILSQHRGTKAVKGLALKFPRTNRVCLNTKAFKKMNRLRLLQLSGVRLDGNFKYLSGDLRWLYWHGLPSTYPPAEFQQRSLVAIDLKYSNLKQIWKKDKMLENLKILNLSHSRDLTETPDFSYLPNLEKLVLKDCPSLSAVSRTIGSLHKLLLINLKDCTGLHSLPRSIYKLKSLETLILSGCSKIDKLKEDLEQMESLTTLIADKTAITKVPFSIVRPKKIGYISLCGFEGFSRDVFPSLVWSWMSPTNNVISLVQASASMSSLVPYGSSYSLSSTIKDLPKLLSLCGECGSELQLTQDVARILDVLRDTNCQKLVETSETTPQISNMFPSPLIDSRGQVHIPGSKNYLKSDLLIQMGTKLQVPNIAEDSILQSTDGTGDFVLLCDDNSDWSTFSGKGCSVIFEVPKMMGRNLKRMMLRVVYSSSPDNITSTGFQNVLIINYTKAIIQVYKRDTLTSFEDEEWQSITSNLEPGNRVEVMVVFEEGFVVEKTTVYLLYEEETIEKEMDVIVSSDDDDRNVSVSGGHDVSTDNNLTVYGGDDNDVPVDKNIIFGEEDENVSKDKHMHDHVVGEDVIVSGEDGMAANKNVLVSGGDHENRSRRLFILPSIVKAVLISRPFWIGLGGILIWITCLHFKKRRSRNPITRYTQWEKWLVDCAKKLITYTKANEPHGVIVGRSGVN